MRVQLWGQKVSRRPLSKPKLNFGMIAEAPVARTTPQSPRELLTFLKERFSNLSVDTVKSQEEGPYLITIPHLGHQYRFDMDMGDAGNSMTYTLTSPSGHALRSTFYHQEHRGTSYKPKSAPRFNEIEGSVGRQIGSYLSDMGARIAEINFPKRKPAFPFD